MPCLSNQNTFSSELSEPQARIIFEHGGQLREWLTAESRAAALASLLNARYNTGVEVRPYPFNRGSNNVSV